jgi:hypothetical protein
MLIPLVGFKGLEGFGWERSIYNGPDFLEGRGPACRKDLYRHIPQCRGLSRAGHDLSPGGIGSQLVQQSVLRSAANDTNLPDTLLTHVFQISKNKTIFEGEAFQNTPYVRARFLGNGLLGSRAELVDGCEHVGGSQEGLVIGIYKVTERRFAGRQFD